MPTAAPPSSTRARSTSPSWAAAPPAWRKRGRPWPSCTTTSSPRTTPTSTRRRRARHPAGGGPRPAQHVPGRHPGLRPPGADRPGRRGPHRRGGRQGGADPGHVEVGEVIPTRTLIWGAGLMAAGQDAGGRPAAGRSGAHRGRPQPGRPPGGLRRGRRRVDHGRGQRPRPTPAGLDPRSRPGARRPQHVAKRVAGQPTEPFHYHDKGTMATIGRGAAVAQTRGGRTLEAAPPGWPGRGPPRPALDRRDQAKAVVDWTWAGFNHERAGRISVRTDKP